MLTICFFFYFSDFYLSSLAFRHFIFGRSGSAVGLSAISLLASKIRLRFPNPPPSQKSTSASNIRFSSQRMPLQSLTLQRRVIPKFNYFTACLYPSTLFQSPLVKSGNLTGKPLFSIDAAVNSPRHDHSAASYTSWSNGSPFCKQ